MMRQHLLAWQSFPRFVLSGGWYRNLTAAARPPR